MFERYVGLPFLDKGRSFEGVDCWGLVWLANRTERGIELPSYSDRYLTAADRKAIASLIAGEAEQQWDEIAKGSEIAWDCVLLRDGLAQCHVGLVVSPGRMLQVHRGMTSAIESYRTGRWSHRVMGFFRYRRNDE